MEKGGTSTRFKGDTMTPGLAWLAKTGVFDGARSVLDYGSGRYSRNATALRKMGLKVYCFDPFHGGVGDDGWEGISADLPGEDFDIGFTSFVLNVVPEYIEEQILKRLTVICEKHYHIVRDDIFKMVKSALERGDKTVSQFFLDEFATSKEGHLYRDSELPDETVMEFCQFGTATTRGFQRLCTMEELGLNLLHRKSNSYKILG